MYSNLLESLHHLKKYVSEHLEDEMVQGYLTDEKKEELTRSWKKHSQEFEKIKDLASLHLSHKAVLILEQYEKRKKEARHSDSIFEWMELDLEAVTQCLESLKIEAKKDLKIK
ncbi:MAG: hypothetical protein JRI88_02010 [Deltaproteobacteria bacterium]|nr:hypothetical protein [Deltaproteobacteria bacterium]MBW1940273.1 hypothetical protein [Deltaproteobacteria bacterium]